MTRMMWILVLLLAFGALPGIAAAENTVAGKWDCTATSPDGDAIKFVLNVKEESGKLTGSITTDNGQTVPIPKLEFANGVLTFEVNYRNEPYTLELKPAADKLEGTWKGSGETGPIKGIRKAS